MNAVEKVEIAIKAMQQGKMVIMVDEEDRENEGDIVFAAEHTTPQLINFMAKEARGLICLTLESSDVDRLQLPMMGDSSKSSPDQNTAFTVSIEARHGVTTGISAADRSHTIKVAIDNETQPGDIVVPGHIFPLRARPGGVLERAGHTEGSVDLSKMAGLKGAAVICEIMNDDGTMARLPDLRKFAEKHSIPIVAISDIIKYRIMRESLVEEVERKTCQTQFGELEMVVFRNHLDQKDHVALVKGKDLDEGIVQVRVHRQRPILDVFASLCGTGVDRLEYAEKLLKDADKAVFVYLTSSPKSPLVLQDVQALCNSQGDQKLPSTGDQSNSMDFRLLGTGAQILRSLGVRQMKVHAVAKRNFVGLSGFGLEVVETIEMEEKPNNPLKESL